jgi:hypothetical protein
MYADARAEYDESRDSPHDAVEDHEKPKVLVG